jgi:nicotinamidase-related amidase
MRKHDFSALIEGSKEAEILPEIKVNKTHKLIVKTRQSTFIRTDFEEQLRKAGIDTLIICGVFTHGCVGRTAIDAYERDFNVIVAQDAIFSHLKDQEKAMLEVIEKEQEQLILNNDEIESMLINADSVDCFRADF